MKNSTSTKTLSIFYIIFMSIFSIVIMYSLCKYIFDYQSVVSEFNALGYPEHLIPILTFGQALGLFILVRNKGLWLPEWAYTGFFINFICAIVAHYMSKAGNGAAAVLCLILLGTIYMLNKKIKAAEKTTPEITPEYNDNLYSI